ESATRRRVHPLADVQPKRPRWARVGRAMAEPTLASLALVAVVTCAQLHPATPKPERDVARSQAAPDAVGAAAASSPLDPSYLSAGGSAPAVTSQDGGQEASQSLQRFSQALSSLAQGKRVEPLRVLWFGDSHTAADYLPNAVRKRLSEYVTLGGPGYVSLGVPGYRHSMVKAWAEGNTELAPHPPARRSLEDDGVFGLGGTRVTLRDASALVTVKPGAEMRGIPTVFELTYRLGDKSDSLHIALGERHIELTSASASPMVGGLRQQRFEGSGEASIEIRATHGRPQVFGVAIEKQVPGLVVDTLGINGARFGTLLSWQEDALALLVHQRHPALIVTAYGTNEVFDPEPVSRHAKEMQMVVERLRRAAPEADCVVIGPTDAIKGGDTTRARAVAMDAAERAIAEATSCVYFSPYEIMASEGGFEAWARQEPPLSLSDGIHLTARGYARIGEALAELLLKSANQN
ncbi:MAG: GDSL-type esterase/lipase family protein, partial [Myxococcales bacterium]